jgi:chromosome segregation protein
MEIGPGLTGVVGPNGCGKSNLVEALRWSMGENSSKKMRGGSGSMEDVIFNGTERRPARTTGEVSLLIDNSDHSAPAPYHKCDEIEVVRKIERDRGSAYRINGKAVRARDVQLLYADILSGANSPYLVSQGRVTTMIQAKPQERRMVLEEAAGITGLYARRHEAELRLRATDKNIERLNDIIGSMESRMADLKKQSRQANRYRNLSGQIRQLEVMIACVEWKTAHKKLHEVKSDFAEFESKIAENMTVVTQLTKTQNVQSMDLPELRQKEAEIIASLQSRKLTLQRLEDEEQHLSGQIDQARNQLKQIDTDRKHQQETLEENTATLEALEREEKSINENKGGEDLGLKEKEEAKEQLKTNVQELEKRFAELMETATTARTNRENLEYQLTQDQERLETVKKRIEDVSEQLNTKKAEQNDNNQLTILRKKVVDLEEELSEQRSSLEKLEAVYADIEIKYEEQRSNLQEKENTKSKIISEINTLESILKMYSDDEFKPVIDEISTKEGFETALSNALGDALMASTDINAPVSWLNNNCGNLSSLPDGVAPIKSYVDGPEVLNNALSQIGVVNDNEQGNSLAAKLKPGQSLVSKDGEYWRWDGLHIKSSASDKNAVQLQQRNKLQELNSKLPKAASEVEEAVTALEKISDKRNKTEQEKSELRQTLQNTEAESKKYHIELNKTVEEQADKLAVLAKLEESMVLAEEDLQHLEKIIADKSKDLASFDDKSLEKQQEKTDAARNDLDEAREELHEAIKDYEVMKQDNSRREARLHAIADERINLQNRCIRGKKYLEELDKRESQLENEIAEKKKRPESIRKESQELLSKITEQEKIKDEISDKLAESEAALSETTKALKDAESKLATVREARAHSQATTSERQQQLDSISLHIKEKFDMTPEALISQAAMSEEQTPDLEELKQNREKFIRSRDMIGPVNLRAEVEAEDLAKELTDVLNDRNDLIEAVQELRQGIQTLNKEAKERLQTAFEHVNAHFREMFTRLFNGGKAYLHLVESDDPLEAGLEIYAQPPGKALQSLSLLSGGEQTLTAIALIFAMFLTNPGPICVLDEVDAPLDDSNVDRFCDLLEEFAEKGKTRFLVITHHRLTMARMDRLYGVTMAEKGVSQLVSVDLHDQMDFLDEVA